jgi:flagellar export protein FliJ
MKSLRTLLKVARRDLDLLRRELADQIGKQQLVDERISGHQQSLQAEAALAARDYESARAFAGYAALAQRIAGGLQGEKILVAAEVERLRELINQAHVEVRKFERLLELEEARERAAQEKREAAELDEFATLTAGRR